MVSFVDTSDDRFAAYAKRQQQAALDKYQAPAKTWDKLQNLHNQAVAGQLDDAGEKDYKATRRLWNREHKSTPVGIMASGVNLDKTPFGAQDLYHDMSSQLFFDQPKTYDRMYPYSPNRWARAVENLAENTMWGQMIKGIAGDREKKVPANVLAMRERFPGVEAFDSGITKLVPDDIKNEEINALNEIANSGEGIFDGGRGDLSPDFDYEEDREGRELSEKISFLQSIYPNLSLNNVYPELIDQLYEQALRDSETIPEINTANTQDEINALKRQIMSNTADEGLDPTKFGDMSKLYDIDANFFDPEAFIEEQKEKGIMPNIITGIDESIEIPAINEQQIINDAVEKNPWLLRIMGEDYKGIRAYLWELGILNPNSDMYKKTSQLEIPE
jgi:hypothetical protein